MPKREDEFWAARKGEKGKGLCPFCGSSKVYYNKYYKSWRCGKCEKSFPSPSYGSGEDFGEEAESFDETVEELRRREFEEIGGKKGESNRAEQKEGAPSLRRAWFGNEYYDPKSKKWNRPKKKGPSVRKIFLALLLIALLAVGVSFIIFAYVMLAGFSI